MKEFAKLFEEIDQTTSTNEKVHAMVDFFRTHDPETSAWSLFFLTGRRPKKLIGAGKLRAWAQAAANLPDWLAEECYSAVGDTAETIALILGIPKTQSRSDDKTLGQWMTERILPLAQMSDEERKRRVTGWWHELSKSEIFILNKCLTGSLRIGVSETLVLRALEQSTGQPRAELAAKILGTWAPSAEFFRSLAEEGDPMSRAEEALPKPFCLASPLEDLPENLGPVKDYQVEWKWDGIRCQVVKTRGRLQIWSRGEERITDSFPDLVQLFEKMSGVFTIDGEILPGSWDRPVSFHELQKRLNRKTPSAKLIRENPVSFLAYDLLEFDGQNFADAPLATRRQKLEEHFSKQVSSLFGLSPVIDLQSWQQGSEKRLVARDLGAEGLMLKKREAPYVGGRKRGVWFKWKSDPLTLDVILTAAQPGTGRRASLFTDYTFSIWKNDLLVPIAKAYSGLTDAEIRELDSWIRKNTLERFGPVRALRPERVFEIGFEGVNVSPRHKSGYAVRFPRILRERLDKKSNDADTVENVETLIRSLNPARSLLSAISEPEQLKLTGTGE